MKSDYVVMMFCGLLAGSLLTMLGGSHFLKQKLPSIESTLRCGDRYLDGRPCLEISKETVDKYKRISRPKYIYDQSVAITGGFYTGHEGKAISNHGDQYTVRITDVEEPFTVTVHEDQLAAWAIFNKDKRVQDASVESYWQERELNEKLRANGFPQPKPGTLE